jgi:hypothetical protein
LPAGAEGGGAAFGAEAAIEGAGNSAGVGEAAALVEGEAVVEAGARGLEASLLAPAALGTATGAEAAAL